MSNPAQPTPPPAGDPSSEARPVSPPFEERLRLAWEKYRGPILGVCLLILLVIVGRFGWEILQQRRAEAAAREFASASQNNQLKAFATEHEGERLAGVAHLKVADEAYEAGQFAEAAEAYGRARDALAETALIGRARLGQGMAMLRSGNTDAGRSALQEVANDVALAKTIRAEAAYHLASLAAQAGAADQVNGLLEQINAIDPNGLWAQRAASLRSTQPAAPAPADPTNEGPAVSFPTANP